MMASSSSWEDNPLEEAVMEFSKRLHIKFPLELPHCIQFSNEAVIKKFAEEEKGNVWAELLQKLGNLTKTGKMNVDEQLSILTHFVSRIQSLIDECIRRHEEYKEKALSLMKERIEGLCKFFRTSVDVKLLVNPEMDINTLRKQLEHGKLTISKLFEIWKFGNLSFYEEQKKLLEQKLEQLEDGIISDTGSSTSEDAQVDKSSKEQNQIDVTEPSLQNTDDNAAMESEVEVIETPASGSSTTDEIRRKRQTDISEESELAQKKVRRAEDEADVEVVDLEWFHENPHPLIFRMASDQISITTSTGFKAREAAVVGINETGEVVCGADALHCNNHWSLQQFLESCSHLNQTIFFEVGGEKVDKLRLNFLLSKILRRLWNKAETERSYTIYTSVITIPIWISSFHRVQIKEGAVAAGFNLARLINQESLAAYGYATKELKDSDDISGIVVVSESFGVISGILYKHNWNLEQESWELTMTGDNFYKSRGNEDTSEKRKAAADFWLSLQAHGDRGQTDMDLKKAVFLFVTESSEWMEAFKHAADEAAYKHDDGSKWFPCLLKFGEMRKAVKEYQTSRLNIRHGNLSNYLEKDSGRFLPRLVTYRIPKEHFVALEKIFSQENILSNEMISVGELNFEESELDSFTSVIELTFETTMEGTVLINCIRQLLRRSPGSSESHLIESNKLYDCSYRVSQLEIGTKSLFKLIDFLDKLLLKMKSA